MERRFFSPIAIASDICELIGDEAHHLSRVLRANIGDEVVLFDNSGHEFLAQITDVSRQRVQLKIVHRELVDRELPVTVHLGVALPKGDRQKWLIEKAVELGVGVITPLVTQFGVAQPTAEALNRLRRQVIEASKQCARNRLMQLNPALPFEAFCRSAPANSTRLFTHPYGTAHISQVLSSAADKPRERPVFIAIGPEGGWSSAELAVATEGGWLGASLGRRILRVETAVAACTAIVAAWLEDGHPGNAAT